VERILMRDGNGGVVIMTDVMTAPHDRIVGGGGGSRGEIIEEVKEETSRKEEEVQ
jgi:hypothetical protein